MTGSQLLTSIGLIMDMCGAVVLVFNFFREDIKSIVDHGGYLKINPNEKTNSYEEVAKKIVSRCREHFYTNLGLFSLIIGFTLQLIAQFLLKEILTQNILLLCLGIISGLVLLFLTIALYIHIRTKQSALLEFIGRITNYDLGRRKDKINLPVGVSIDMLNNVAKIFLSYNFPFNKFGRKKQKPIWKVVHEAYNIKT